MNLLHDFIFCVPATLFITILFKVPKKAAIISTIVGSLGYVFYELTTPILNSPIAAYFISTLIMAIVCEICARIIKMPTTVFIIPCIIPLVPGLGLYLTMSYLVQHQYDKSGQTAITTGFAIIAMAMALVLTSVLTSALTAIIARYKKKSKNS